jgi:hypothetical protein
MRLNELLQQGVTTVRRSGWHPQAYLRTVADVSGPRRFHIEHVSLETNARGSVRLEDVARVFSDGEHADDWEEYKRGRNTPSEEA